MQRKTHKLLLLLTLPLVMWLFFNQVAFWHYHVLDNGLVVEHAHPFNKNPIPGTPYQNHHHTDYEYSILAQLSNVLTVLVVGLFLSQCITGLRENEKVFYATPFLHTQLHYQISRRGPPLL